MKTTTKARRPAWYDRALRRIGLIRLSKMPVKSLEVKRGPNPDDNYIKVELPSGQRFIGVMPPLKDVFLVENTLVK